MLESFHQKLAAPVSDGSVNIVCLGDSVTHGCFESGSEMHSHYDVFESYTVKLHRALHALYPAKIFNVINSGIGGETAARALARFERDVLAYHPDLVIIAFGVNDFGDAALYLRALEEMFDRLNAAHISCIYMTEHMMNTYVADDTAPSVKDYARVTAKAQTDGTMDALFESGKALAKQKNIAVCDVYAKWKALNRFGADTTMLLANRINHPTRPLHDLFVSSLISTMFFEGN
ncbi:MAG: SGNH/GDSL hydrolase family protein [Eubacteriales bacterium]